MLFITNKTPKLIDNSLIVINSGPVTITGKQHLVILDSIYMYTFAAVNLSVRPGSLSSVISHWLH